MPYGVGSMWSMQIAIVIALVLASTTFAYAQWSESGDEEAPAAEPVQPTLGLGEGVSFETADGATRLKLRARIQLRLTQFSEEAGDAPEVTEFQARRIRLLLQGRVKQDLDFYVQLGFSNRDTEPDLRAPLRDAYLTYTKLRDLQIRGGQMKVPFGRQRLVSSSALQMVDRSIVVRELSLDRDVGVQLLSTDLFGLDGILAYNLGVFSGDGRNRLATTPGVLLVARVAVQPFGEFEDYVEGALQREDTPKLSIGATVAHNNNTNRTRSTFDASYDVARFDYRHAGVDLMFKYGGLSVSSEVLYRRASEPFVEHTNPMGEVVREYARNAWGYYAQAGYLANEHFEITARYGEVRPRGTTDPELVLDREAGGGLNWYFQQHDLKLQSDYFYLFGEGDGRHEIRVQAQLYF